MNESLARRKRGRIRRLADRVGRSLTAQSNINATSPGPATSAEAGRSSNKPFSNTPPARSSQTILDQALLELTLEERATIRNELPHDVLDVGTAVYQAYETTWHLQEACKDQSWHWRYRGRQIYLRGEADKILNLLDRIKSIGDVVANVDPVHVGLPWVGIRIILEVTKRLVYRSC